MGRGLKKLLCSLLAVCLLAGSMELPDVRAGQDAEDMVLQSDREKTWQTERCRITFLLTDCWTGGYNATITVRNTSDTAIDSWHVSASIAQPIRNVWNAQMLESTQGKTIFKNLGWNQDIALGGEHFLWLYRAEGQCGATAGELFAGGAYADRDGYASL